MAGRFLFSRSSSSTATNHLVRDTLVSLRASGEYAATYSPSGALRHSASVESTLLPRFFATRTLDGPDHPSEHKGAGHEERDGHVGHGEGQRAIPVESIDPTMLSAEEIRKTGTPPKPDKPGVFQHQYGDLRGPAFFKRELLALYPLFGVVALAAVIGSYQMVHLAFRPDITLSKRRRAVVVEVEDPDTAAVHGEEYRTASFFRWVAETESGVLGKIKRALYEPPATLPANPAGVGGNAPLTSPGSERRH